MTVSRRPSIPESSWRHPGWRVVVGMFLLASGSWGFSFYGLGVYLVALNAHYGWSIADIASLYTMYHLVGAGLLLVVGSLIARVGPRVVLVGGLVVMAGAVAGMAWIDAYWQLAGCLALLAVGWSALSTAAITAVVAPWFSSRRGFAIGLALNGASMAGIAVVPLIAWVVGRHGIETGLPLLAAGMLVVLVPVVLFALADTPPPRPAAAGAEPPRSLRAIASSAAFWRVAGPFLPALMAQVGFLTHQVALLEPSVGVQAAAFGVAASTGAALIGRTGFAALSDRVDMRRMTGMTMVMQAGCLLLLASEPSVFWLYAACAVYGLGIGNLITMPGLIAHAELPAHYFPQAIGLVYGTAQVFYAFGPALLGWIRDASGSYSPALVLAAAMITTGAVALQLTRPKSA